MIMPKFKIIPVDPLKFKKEIISLWEDNLPGTPPGRLEWMNNNPVGATIWYLAIDEAKQIVAGSVSIMPRRLKLRGQIYVAGIVGDFMIKKEYRVFGPTLQLMKTAIKNHSRLGFAFLYTFPNQASEKIVLRAGFREIGLTKRFVKILNPGNIAKKYMNPTLANMISPGLHYVLRMLSKETYMKSDLTINEIIEPESLTELTWGGPKDQWLTIGERNSAYIKWRYFQNPLHRFRMYIYKRPAENIVLGHIIFSIKNNNVYIFDIIFYKQNVFKSILGCFLKDMRKQGYDSISIRITQESPLNGQFRKFGFFDRREDIPLLFVGDSKLIPAKWLFFNGDRNV